MQVFCTKSKPNCNACPMRGECRHFASAFARYVFDKLRFFEPIMHAIKGKKTLLCNAPSPGIFSHTLENTANIIVRKIEESWKTKLYEVHNQYQYAQ